MPASVNSSAGLYAALRTLSGLERTNAASDSRPTPAQTRLNDARENSSSFSVSGGVRAAIRASEGVRSVLDSGRAVVGAAQAGATRIKATLEELKSLALEATQPGNSTEKLKSLAADFNSRLGSIDKIIGESSYHGINLLDGSRNSVGFVGGARAGTTVDALNADYKAGVLNLLTANSIEKTIPKAPPKPDPFKDLVTGIADRVQEKIGLVTDATARDFANRFIDQVGRSNEPRVKDLGNKLLNTLSGSSENDAQNRRIVARVVDGIAGGASRSAIASQINDLIGRLTNPPSPPPPPPPQPEKTTLRVEFLSEGAGYRNVVGYYNKETGKGGILFQNVEAEGSNAPLTPGQSTVDFTVDAADANKINFFLIADGANQNSTQELAGPIKVTQAADGSYGVARADANGEALRDAQGNVQFLKGTGAKALFTETSKNAGGVDYASSITGAVQTVSTLAGDTTDGPTGILAFEDLAAPRNSNGTYGAPGDADYNDAVFNVIKLPPPPPPAPESKATLRATFVSESAGYRNSFGYYNKETGEAQVLFANVEAEGADASLRPGLSTVDFQVKEADLKKIAYFLIPDGANQNSNEALSSKLKAVRDTDGTYGIARLDANGEPLRDAQGNIKFLSGTGSKALFTERAKNEGKVDYASSIIGTDQTKTTLRADTKDGPTGTIAFEDLAAVKGSNGKFGKPGDADYNDAVFSVARIDTPATTTLRADFVSESAGYRNTFGYYNRKTGEAGILFQNVEAEGSNPTLRPGISSAEFSVKTSDLKDIQYFLVADGANQNSAADLAGGVRVARGSDGNFGVAKLGTDGNLSRDGQGNIQFLKGVGAPALFTQRGRNEGDVDYASATTGTGQTTATLRGDTKDGPTGKVAFEDLVATRNANGTYGAPGDADYNDAVFNIVVARQTPGSDGPPPPGGPGGGGPGGGGPGGGDPGGGGPGGPTDPGNTGPAVTLNDVVRSVNQAINLVNFTIGRLASTADVIERQDRFVARISSALDSALNPQVEPNLDKDSAVALAGQVQRGLALETIGITGSRIGEGLSALFNAVGGRSSGNQGVGSLFGAGNNAQQQRPLLGPIAAGNSGGSRVSLSI